MEKKYIDKLKEIRGETYEKLIDGKIKKYFHSLGDVYEADADAMVADSLVKGFGYDKGVLLQMFQNKLNVKKEYYCKIWEALQPIKIMIPDDCFAIKLNIALKHIKEYYYLQEWINKELGYTDSKILCSDILDKYYGINDEFNWLENLKIAEIHNCKPQNVDTIRLDKMMLEKTLIGENSHIEIIFEGTTFIRDLFDNKYKSRIRTILDKEGKLDDKLLDRYTEIFGFSLTKLPLYSEGEDLIERYFLTNKNEIGSLKENIRILKMISKDKVFSRTIDDIITDVKKSWEKNKYSVNEKLILAIIKGKEMFERDFEADEEKYFTKWFLLAENKARVARILLTQGRSMFRKEIFDEYNHLCAQNDISGLEHESQINISHKNVISRGNNLWIFGEHDSTQESIEKAMEKFAINANGPFLLDEMYKEISPNFPNYDYATIKSYVTMRAGCRPIVQNTEFDYIHETLRSNFPHLKVAERQNSGIGYKIIQGILNVLLKTPSGLKFDKLREEVKKLIEKEFGEQFRVNLFRQLLDNLLHEEFVIKQDNEFLIASLDGLSEKEILSIGRSSEPAYRTAIKDRVVQILKSRNNKPIQLTDLWPQVKDLYPKDIVVNNWYKIFNDQELFIKEKDGTKTYISLKLEVLPLSFDPKEEVVETLKGITQEQLETLQLMLSKPFNPETLFKQISEVLYDEYLMPKSRIDKGVEVMKIYYNKYENINNPSYVLLQGIHRVWNFKTDIYDRRVCIDKLAISYETFLKKLIWNNDRYIGLGLLLEEDKMTKKLKFYRKNYRYEQIGEVDHLMKKMSEILKKIIEMADALRHNNDDERVQVNYHEGNLLKNIKDFVALYFYTASIVEPSF